MAAESARGAAWLRRLAERASRRVVLRRKLRMPAGDLVLVVTPASALSYWRRDITRVDPQLLALAQEFVRPGHVVWDIGANVGLFAFAAASMAGLTGGVLAVEPDGWLASLLVRSKELNRGKTADVTVLQVAVADSVSIRQLCVAERGLSANFLEGAGGSTQAGGIRARRPVVAVSLDWLRDQFAKPDVVKIDVEGAEGECLRGAERLLAEGRPILLCEVGPGSRESVGELLRRHGYDLFDGAIPAAQRRSLATPAWSTVAIPHERTPGFGGISGV